MKHNYLKAILLLFILHSCSNKDAQILEIETIKYSGSNIPSMVDIIESASIIPLKGEEKILFGDRPMIIHRDSSFYIVDRSGSRVIYRFNEDGRLLNTIGRVGKSSQEYIALSNVYVEDEKDSVYILSPPSLSLYCYSKDGNFRWKKTSGLCPLSFTVNEDVFWLYMGYNGIDGNHRLITVDSCLNINSKLMPLDTKIFPVQGDPNFTKGDKDIYFREELNSSIYSLEGDSLRLRYNFDFGNYNVPKTYFTTDKPFEAMESLLTNGFINIRNFWDTKNHIFIEALMQKGSEGEIIYGIKNKSSEKWNWISYNPSSSNLFINNIKGFSLNNELMILASGADLSNMTPEEKKIINIEVDSTKEDDSFIVLCKLK